jgi:hypothetical protein
MDNLFVSAFVSHLYHIQTGALQPLHVAFRHTIFGTFSQPQEAQYTARIFKSQRVKNVLRLHPTLDLVPARAHRRRCVHEQQVLS